MRWRYREKVYYLHIATNPAELRVLDVGTLATDLAKALAATGTRYRPPVAECVDDARIERARATLAEFDRVRRTDARIALLDLFEEAVKLRMLLGDAEEREAAIAGAEGQAITKTPGA